MKAARPGAEAPSAGSDGARGWKRSLVVLSLLAVAATAAAAAWYGFSRWQQHRLANQAAELFRKGDLRGAYFTAGRILQKDPRDLAACRISAHVAEIDRSPVAIFWRQKIADILPGTAAPLIDLAVTATGFGETYIAGGALAQVSPADRGTLPWLQAAAGLAIAESRHAAAEEHLAAALKLDPQNESLQLSLATLRLGLSDAARAAEAKAVLDRLREKPQFRQEAMRALLADARRRGDSALALNIAADLRKGPAASLADDLRYLDELHHSANPALGAELDKLRNGAVGHPGSIYAVMTWMTAHNLATKSAQWAESLAPKIRAQMPVPLAESEALTALHDWKRLRELVRDADWGDMDFLRLAIHARVLLESDSQRRRRTEFRTAWERATNATRGNPNSLMMLGRLVNGWGWDDEAAQAWWLAAKNSAGGRVALKALFEKFSSAKNTRELYRVARRVLELEPASPVAKNNVASLALLLGEDEAEAHRIAEEIHRLSPGQPAIATTYALSLHRRKRTAEAVAVLKKLPPQAFSEPSAAACFGSLLAENGERDAARPLLELAERQKQQLFPEEAAMAAETLRRIQ